MRLLVIAVTILRTIGAKSSRNVIVDDDSAEVALPPPALFLGKSHPSLHGQFAVLAQPLGSLNDLYPSTSKEKSTEEQSWIPFEEDTVRTVDNNIDMNTPQFMSPTRQKDDRLPSSTSPCPSTSSICSTAVRDLSFVIIRGVIEELESSRSFQNSIINAKSPLRSSPMSFPAPCDCDCSDEQRNTMDVRIRMQKGPNFYLEVNGMQPLQKSSCEEEIGCKCGSGALALGRKENEEVESGAVNMSTADATAKEIESAMSAIRPVARKMLAETQRAFVNRVKRQNREDDCRCCWCSRPDNNRDDGSSNSRDVNFQHRPSYGGPTPQQQREQPPSDYARTFAPSAPFTPGGNDARRRDFGRPFAPAEFPPYARRAYDAAPRAPRDLAPPPYAQVNGHPLGQQQQQQWPSYSSAPVFNPFPRAHPTPPPHPPPPRAGVPYGPTPPLDRDQSGFGPLQSRMSQGGVMRGSGTFARALQMKSPFPWMRNWMTESSRLRHGMLGLDSRYNQ